MSKADIAVVGLAVMGENLILIWRARALPLHVYLSSVRRTPCDAHSSP